MTPKTKGSVMKHKTDYPEINYQTVTYWRNKRLVPKDEEVATRLWSNPHHNGIYNYYTIEQLRPMTEEELEELKSENRAKNNKAKERRKRKELDQRREELDNYKKLADAAACTARYEQGRALGKELMEMAKYVPVVPCDNNTGIIVFDVETTGLSPEYDEIIQISIINGNGEKLLDEYVRPYWSSEWKEAEAINGITPVVVKDAPFPHQLIPKVKGIFESADLLIAYNNSFDLSFLKKWGISAEGKKQIDVMQEFAPIYGEWNEYYEDYKWQKLTTCARYYGYEFDAHDSLEDVKATLFCYKQMQLEIEEKVSDGELGVTNDPLIEIVNNNMTKEKDNSIFFNNNKEKKDNLYFDKSNKKQSLAKKNAKDLER